MGWSENGLSPEKNMLPWQVAEINGQPLEDEQPLESTASARRPGDRTEICRKC